VEKWKPTENFCEIIGLYQRTMMKHRTAKKIHKRWLKLTAPIPPWKYPTLDKALNYWLWERYHPHKVSDRAWQTPTYNTGIDTMGVLKHW